MTDNTQQPSEQEHSRTDADETSETNQNPGNISGVLYLVVFSILVMAISYGLTFIWPSEDKSLTYLPKFLTSCVLAFMIPHFLGLRMRS